MVHISSIKSSKIILESSEEDMVTLIHLANEESFIIHLVLMVTRLGVTLVQNNMTTWVLNKWKASFLNNQKALVLLNSLKLLVMKSQKALVLNNLKVSKSINNFILISHLHLIRREKISFKFNSRSRLISRFRTSIYFNAKSRFNTRFSFKSEWNSSWKYVKS